MSAWTDDQWESFCALVDEAWHGDFDRHAADAWRLIFDGTPPEDAARGLRLLLHEGRPHRPSASEVLAAARRDPSVPTFDEALALALWAATGPPERLARVHPLVAAFVARQGAERLRTLPLYCPDYGELRRRELRAAWDAHAEAFEGREAAAAALALPRGEGLRRLDPLAALGPTGGRRMLPEVAES